MAHQPNASAAPAARSTAPAPARPVGVPAQLSPVLPGAPPAGRGAWAVGRERLRAAATTEPGRLQILGAVLALLVVAFGTVTALEVHDRFSVTTDVAGRSRLLSNDAASVYRALAEADTTAASGFLAGSLEPTASRKRYDADIATASQLLVKAASNTGGSQESIREITILNEQLPRYTGLVERARAANRQGLPLGGAYLRYANHRMTTVLLPAAKRLYEAETERLHRDDRSARAWPYLSLALGLLALAALGGVQRREYLRTHRVFNHGLLAATAATAGVLLWLGAAHAVARAGLDDARTHGQESLQALNTARISSLTARANENLALVARGAVLTEDGKNDKYEVDHTASMNALKAALAQAGRLADDEAGRAPVDDSVRRVAEWEERHEDARAKDREGSYQDALDRTVGPGESTSRSFSRIDGALDRALDHERAEFTRSAEDARDALEPLPLGAAALGVLGAAGAVLGVNRRLSEYR